MVRRGHSSHNGLDSVIDLLTGSPLHFHVLSHFYRKCKYFEGADISEPLGEKHSYNCPKNVEGTANAMEVKCARILWRSEANFKLRYSTMMSGWKQ